MIQSAQSGPWNNTATWVGGVIPDPAYQEILINHSHAVTFGGGMILANNHLVTIQGTLTFATATLIGGPIGPVASSLSVLERIAEHVVSTLAAINTSAGYANTVADALRPNPGIGNDTIDRRLIVVQGDSAREWDAPEQYTQFLQDFLIVCMVQESETSSTSIDERLNSLASDVEYALCFDRASQTRGGMAEDTILEARSSVEADVAAHDGAVVVHVQVRYRTQYNNPLKSIYDP